MNCGKENLLIEIDKSDLKPLYRQISDSLSELIMKGALCPGDLLPSIRRLAENLEVSRATIERAYDFLYSEGLVEKNHGSGHVISAVSRVGTEHGVGKEPNRLIYEERAGLFPHSDPFELTFDFSCLTLDPSFCNRKHLAPLLKESAERLFDEGFNKYASCISDGRLELEILKYLYRSRGIDHSGKYVVVSSDITKMLVDVLLLLGERGTRIGIENPGIWPICALIKRLGYEPVLLSIDKGEEVFFAELDIYEPKVVIVSPSNQFPTGNSMNMQTRERLLEWAKSKNAFILEDDRKCELWYQPPSLPSLMSLDRSERVVYFNSFSLVLSPGLPVAYCVMPSWFSKKYRSYPDLSLCSVSLLDREVLVSLLRDGPWDAYLRKITSCLKRRCEKLNQSIFEQLRDVAEWGRPCAGSHFYLRIDNGMTQQELVMSAKKQGALVSDANACWMGMNKPCNGVVLGFGAIEEKDIPDGVGALAEAWL